LEKIHVSSLFNKKNKKKQKTEKQKQTKTKRLRRHFENRLGGSCFIEP
jgi:hypothetical protein